MNIQLQRSLDRYVGMPLCALLSLINRLRKIKVPTGSPRNIIVVLLSEMGSLVLARAMFEELRRRYPGSSIHVMLFARNREVLELLDLVPGDNVMTLDDHSMPRFVRDFVTCLIAMRRLKFDVVIDCELFSRVSSIISFLTGAAIRVGFHPHTQEGLYRGSFINRPVIYNPYRHLSRQFMTLARAVDSDSTPVAKEISAPEPAETPMLEFRPGELDEIAAALKKDFPSIDGKLLVLVYPSGGMLPIRAWPLVHYEELCRGLLADGYAVGVIGLASDKAIGRAVTERCANPLCIDLTGYTKTVRHLLGLFHRAALLITNDGGPGQFAVLTPIPSIVLFGPETPFLYRPLSGRAHCIHLEMSCSPCLTAYNHRLSACDGDNRCLSEITPGQVLDLARKILSGAGE